MSAAAGEKRPRRTGNAVFFVVVVLTLLGFVALVVDLGYLRHVQGQLQNATDAAALAGADHLDRTEAGLALAPGAAVDLGNANFVQGAPPGLDGEDVTVGVWDFATSTFTPATEPAEDIDAVRVVKSVSEVPTLFALAAFGADYMTAGATSYGVRPPPEPALEVPCFLPLAIPDCRFAAGQPPEEIANVTFQMSPSGADNAAWALPRASNPDAHDVTELVHADYCDPDALSERTVSLNTGAMADVFREVATEINRSPDAWDTERWGPIPPQLEGSLVNGYGDHVLQGVVMMFRSDAYCADADGDGQRDGGGFNEDDLEISGLAWGVLFDVKGQGGGRDAAGNIQLRLDMTYDETIGTGGGGGYNTGVQFQGPAYLPM